jgi:LmbE family N-acetylglucosaminyl deacetylase
MSKNPYHEYANSFRRLAVEGRNLPFGGIPKPEKTELAEDAPVALILSPHPDDECVIGGLALRLLRESGVRVVNVAVTLGSKRERQAERLDELRGACDWIGFELQETIPRGLKKVTPETREKDPEHWKKSVDRLGEIIDQQAPQAIFFPHASDWNGTHIGVHLLTLDSLRQRSQLNTLLIETEYWGQMPSPNLMVENTPEEVGDLLAALSHHKGELKRNAFHLGLPAWMQDNVRLGAEVVGGQGGEAPDFAFATLYRVSRWANGQASPAWAGGKMLPSGGDSSSALFSPTA